MDKRTLRSRKAKPRNARPYDRQNQSIFGKVCSKVKGLLNPSWLFNVSHWISNSEEEQPGGSSDVVEEENVRDDNDVVSQSVSHGSKRLRLRLDEHVPSIQSSGTQTLHDQPSQNLYETISRVQSSSTQSSFLEKEIAAVLNGDDHSENSEGSASTSGCSSLVSSHKESNRLAESPFASLIEIKSRKRKEPSSKSGFNDLNSSRGLWSSSFSPSSKCQRRLPTISHTNQPSFNLSSFGGPSKLNESVEKKISSPFYEGRTTFGGASASRRMPPSVAPYQVDKTLRNQIRVREQSSDDNLEGMSSAAKRILLTLEKMNTPVADAKRIPNSDTSPVDLSLYLTPPKSRRNSQFTPSVASKGPPIANINTIAKLATLKNYGTSRLRNTLQNSPVTSVDQKTPNFDFLQPSTSETVAQKSGGGKMKNKLNQHHHSLRGANAENEAIDTPVLKSIPLPISTLPTINFGSKTEKPVGTHLAAKGFTFSNPIEHDLSISNTVPVSTLALPSPYDSFKFSNPIEHELPNSNTLPKEKAPLPTWECSACWVRNPQSRTSCVACETPRVPKEKSSGTSPFNTSGFSTFQPSQPTNANFQFGCQPSESTAASIHGTSTSFTFAKSEASNQIPSSMSQKPVSSFGSTSNFVFGSKNETSNKMPSTTVSQTPGLGFGSSTSFTQVKKTENANTSSQNPTLTFGSSTVASVFGNTSTPRTTTVISTTTGNTCINAETWECSSCWVKNPLKESKCMACEAPRSTKDKKVDTTSTIVTPTVTSNINTGSWECSSCWVKNPMKESKCMACETPRSTKEKNSEMKSSVSNAFSTWECSSCWVRNPMKEKKCMACETLHPSADVNSVVKDANGFKFSSPLQNSPLTFKFGNYICTAPSTVTTSSFKFGVSANEPQTTTISSSFKFGINANESQTTTPSSGFKFGAPSSVNSFFNTTAVSTTGSKPSDASSLVNQSSSITAGFKMPPVTSSTTENKEAEQISNNFTCENAQANKFSCITETSESIPEPSKVSSESKVIDTIKDSLTRVTESTPEPAKVSSAITDPLQVDKGSKSKLSDTVITSNSSNISISKEKEVPLPSVTACFGFTTQPVQSVTKDTNENKLSSVFQLTSDSRPSSAFTSPANLFKFGEKADSTKINLSTTSVALTTATATSFSFSNNISNFGPNSKGNEVSSAATETRPAPVKTEESKIPASISFSSVTTTNSFVFGSAVTTSAPSAFSFFPSSSTSTSTTPVFTFGASSNTTQVSKPGGFTFKGLEKPQTTPAISSSTSQSANPGLNVGTSAPVPSGGFVFGTPKTEAQNVTPVSFAFGSGAATSSSNTSAFSAFQPSQPANATFQFGSQPPGSTASTLGTSTNFAFAKSEAPNQIPSSVSQNPVSAFGSTTTNFVFGSKNETPNPISGTVSQPSSLAFGPSANFTFSNKTENTNTASQNPTPTFGSSAVPSVFGNNSVPPSFDGSDKSAAGGFNFGVPSSGVFQFGVSNNTEKKRTATASGFSFGTPAASETNNSFPTGFSMSTPPSFNFGAASTPAGPFQFVASTAAKPASAQSAPRKYRKALRRVTRKD